MKNIVRRVSAAIIIFAFFLPWFDLFLFNVNGVQLINAAFGFGTELDEPVLTALGIAAIILVALAIWTVIQPKLLAGILLFTLTTLLLILVYTANGSELVIATGIYILTIGATGLLVSFFLKRGPVTYQRELRAGTKEAAAANQKPITSAKEKLFCSSCGTKVLKDNTFCKNCGQNLA